MYGGDWGDVAQSTVARARALVGAGVDDPYLAGLVAELSAQSDEFRRLWARHDVQLKAWRPHVFNHPLVGPIDLQPDRLAIIAREGQVLLVLHAEPGSPSERALARLASIAAGEDREHM